MTRHIPRGIDGRARRGYRYGSPAEVDGGGSDGSADP